MGTAARYLLLKDAVINGALYQAGASVNYAGWPPGPDVLKPLNQPAAAVLKYWTAYRTNPFFPRSPVNALSMQMPFLPATLPGARGIGVDYPALPRDAPDHAPLYQLTVPRNFGGVLLPTGEIVHYLGWPEGGLSPRNSAARAVIDYWHRYQHHEARLPSPWCLCRNGPFLPELPKPEKEDLRPAYVGAPAPGAPMGFTPQPWTTTPRIPPRQRDRNPDLPSGHLQPRRPQEA
jgi:hypothetical protein